MSDFVRPHRWQPTRLPVPGILQARTLEWVAISFSNAWKWKVKVKSLSRVRLSATPWTVAYQAPPSMGFSRQKYWSGVPLPSPDTCIPVANSCWCMANIITILQSNYPPIKINKLKKKVCCSISCIFVDWFKNVVHIENGSFWQIVSAEWKSRVVDDNYMEKKEEETEEGDLKGETKTKKRKF